MAHRGPNVHCVCHCGRLCAMVLLAMRHMKSRLANRKMRPGGMVEAKREQVRAVNCTNRVTRVRYTATWSAEPRTACSVCSMPVCTAELRAWGTSLLLQRCAILSSDPLRTRRLLGTSATQCAIRQ